MLQWWRNQRANQLMKQATALAKREEYLRAAHVASAAILLMPNNPNYYERRGQWYQLGDNTTSALEDFSKAIALTGHDANLYYLRGLAYADHGDHSTAIQDFTLAVQHAPNFAAAFQARGKSYIARDEIDHAIEDFSAAIASDPAFAANYRYRAELFALQGKYHRAVEDYDHVVQNLQTGIEKANHVVNQMEDAAGSELEWARQIVTQLKDELAEVYVQRGMVHHQQGSLPSALEDLNAAITHNPNNAFAYSARGRVRYQQNDIEAIDDFEVALHLDPHRFATYLNLAEVYFKLNQFEKAKHSFEKLDNLSSGNVIAQIGLALSDHALGKKREAYQRWRTLIEHDSQFADLKWLKKEVFVHYPVLWREASNLVIRL